MFVRAPLFEAVPNFSEGKDATKISRITEAVRAVSGVRILDLHSDPDHNRSVLTFAGGEDSVFEGALVLAKACAAELDLASQTGEHPRMGVLDVLPFVPLEGATMDDAVRLAHRAGELLGSLGFPVFYYGSAATASHRRSLPDIRRGGYEGVAFRLGDPLWQPDSGPKTLDPSRGAVAVGGRPRRLGRVHRARRLGTAGGDLADGPLLPRVAGAECPACPGDEALWSVRFSEFVEACAGGVGLA